MNKTFLDKILEQTQEGSTVLLAGCGGGFDVYSGVPLLSFLRAHGRKVVLANLTFRSDFRHGSCHKMVENTLWRVEGRGRSDPRKEKEYFPELYLSEYLNQPVYTIERRGAEYVHAAYAHLLKEFDPACFILIDGGTDSLTFGNESSLGTPEEDYASMAALTRLETPHPKYLVCLGYGVDAFHGVCHNDVLQNTATLSRKQGFLGTLTMLPHHSDFQLFQQACEYAFERMETSIVCGSVLHATNGKFGDYKFTPRTGGTPLFLNPLMSMYFAYDLRRVAEENLFISDPAFQRTKSCMEISRLIREKRQTLKIKEATPFPH
jgi:hypothetical protein